jgi:hypothetical protein
MADRFHQSSTMDGTGNDQDSDDGLWSEFENCAQAAVTLYRKVRWAFFRFFQIYVILILNP